MDAVENVGSDYEVEDTPFIFFLELVEEIISMYLPSSHPAHLDLIFRYFYTIVLPEEVFH